MITFLIIRFSSIGDIVLTTPVIRCLKEQVENARIHYLTKEAYAPLVASNPYVDRVHILRDNLSAVIREIREIPVDYLIDLHHNLRSGLVKSRLRIMSFSFNKLNWQKWLLVHFKKDRLPDLHIVDRYLDTVKLFDVKNDGLGLDYFIPIEETVQPDQLPEAFRKGFIALAIGAKHQTKKLTPDQLVALADLLEKPVVLLGGPEDRPTGEEIAGRTKTPVFNACGRFSLNGSASLLQLSRLVISHDTGMMHIAAALKKTILSVWGNTVPKFGMYPYMPGPGSQIFEVKDLACRPCSKIGFQKCPKKHFRCMLDQDLHALAEKARKVFDSAPE